MAILWITARYDDSCIQWHHCHCQSLYPIHLHPQTNLKIRGSNQTNISDRVSTSLIPDRLWKVVHTALAGTKSPFAAFKVPSALAAKVTNFMRTMLAKVLAFLLPVFIEAMIQVLRDRKYHEQRKRWRLDSYDHKQDDLD